MSRKRGQFSIKPFVNRSGTESFRVTGTMNDGRFIRENFTTFEHATERKHSLEIEAANMPPADFLKRTRLTQEQIDLCERAIAELPTGKNILQAVRFFAENFREPLKGICLKAVSENDPPGAFDEFFKFKKEVAKCRERTLQKIKSRVGSFVKKYPSLLMSEVTPEQIADHIARGGAENRNSIRRELRAFFNWGIKKKYCAKNPVLETEAIRTDDKDIASLSLDEVRRLLKSALTYSPSQKTRTGKIVSQKTPAHDGGLIPFLTLGLFAGLRPDEIARLKWSDIDLEEKQITVASGKAKTRRRRVVEISDNLVSWLAPFKKDRRPIYWRRLDKHFRRVRIQAGFRPAEKITLTVPKELKHLKPWVEDYCRHTAVSAHLAFHKSEDRTALWGGHSVDVLHGHYKGLMTTKDAAEFWEITPDDVLAFHV